MADPAGDPHDRYSCRIDRRMGFVERLQCSRSSKSEWAKRLLGPAIGRVHHVRVCPHRGYSLPCLDHPEYQLESPPKQLYRCGYARIENTDCIAQVVLADPKS